MCGKGGGGEEEEEKEEAGGGENLKTRTPHNDVGNKPKARYS